MNILYTVAQEAGQSPNIFEFNLGVSFWTIVIFLGLLAILVKYAFPAILGYADEREKRIQEILDAAARDREESERLLEEQRAELGQARQQAQQIIGEAKEAAERVHEEILEQARADQEALVERTRLELARERDRAVETIRREAIELSLAAASRLIEERLDDEKDRELVRDYLEHAGTTSRVGAA